MDYKILDTILNYLYKEKGCFRAFRDFQTSRNETKNEIYNTEIFISYCNILEKLGLVEHKSTLGRFNAFAITIKGIELLKDGKSSKDAHEEIKQKEQLETKILESTINSARLNKIQLWVTIILGAVSAISIASLFFQYEANKIAKRNLEIVEKTYLLELENKKKVTD